MHSRRSLVLAVVTGLAVAASAVPADGAPPESPGLTTRASVRSGGAQAVALVPAAAGSPALSAGTSDPATAPGRFVAFVSEASNLVPGDSNGQADVFVRDRVAATTALVSGGINGAPADGPSRGPAISADGRYVAFESDAANLVTGDARGETDVFLRDLQTGTTTRLTGAPDGAEANGSSANVSISHDGQTVAFDSDADNLVANDTNDAADVFVRKAGVTTLVSQAAGGGAPGNLDSYRPALSGNGLVVAFGSDATDLVAGDSNDAPDIFIRVVGGTVNERVSVNSDEAQGDDGSYEPSISGDGGVVAFSSDAGNLAPAGADTNNLTDVFVRVRGAGGTTERVSVGSGVNGAQADGPSYEPQVSADGSLVAFVSEATNLVASDANSASDVFLHARGATPDTTQVSVADDGSPFDLPSVEPGMTPDGLTVAFANGPIDPGTGGAGSGGQILVRDRSVAPPATVRVDVVPNGEPGGPPVSSYPAMSETGRYVAFVSSATDLVDGDTNGLPDVFVHDREAKATARVSVGPGGEQADGSSLSFPFLSADGRLVAFESEATNLVPGDDNGANDVFVHDREKGLTARVSVGSGGQADAGSFSPFISGNGRFVAFASVAENLVPDDTNHSPDIFVRDLEAGTTERVSVGPGGAQVLGTSFFPSLSRDGRHVAFTSGAAGLVVGDTNAAVDAFVHDRESDTTTRVTVGPDGAEADGDTGYSILSADGRFVTFSSHATNLVPGDTNGRRDVFVVNLGTKAIERVSVGPPAPPGGGGAEGDKESDSPWVSGDGRYAAFVSDATNLVPGDTNGKTDAFVRDRLLGTTTRVSVAVSGQSNGQTIFPTLSGDGRFVTFSSDATNLVAGDSNLGSDVFVHDTAAVRGYRLVATDGGIFAFGDAGFFGSTGATALNKPIVGMASTPTGQGYWLVASDGGIFAFGDAGFFGSTGAFTLNRPIVGMATTPTGRGYWLVATDGGIFAFGDAAFAGSTGATPLNQPIVAMAATPTGKGYWLVASDGGIFAFGDAAFAGSTGAIKLNQPIVGMAATPSGRGYWLVASDGGIFAFGDAAFAGSTGAIKLNQPIVGMAATPSGRGYWLVASDGGIFAFGDAAFAGSTGAIKLNQPIVGMAPR